MKKEETSVTSQQKYRSDKTVPKHATPQLQNMFSHLIIYKTSCTGAHNEKSSSINVKNQLLLLLLFNQDLSLQKSLRLKYHWSETNYFKNLIESNVFLVFLVDRSDLCLVLRHWPLFRLIS